MEIDHGERVIIEKSLGLRQEIIVQDCAGFWFVYKAHPPVHIRICAGGCNAVDGPKDKQDVQLFLAEALKFTCQ